MTEIPEIIGEPTIDELDDDFDYNITTSSSGRVAIEWTNAYNVYVDPENEMDAVIAWARANLPVTFDEKPRRSFRISEDGLTNPGEYKFILTFKTPENEDESEEVEINPTVEVDCVQGRMRMRYALKNVYGVKHRDMSLDSVPNFKGGINVSDNGIEGAEVVAPSFTWTETWNLPKTTATWSYLKAIGALRGRTNLAAFRGCPTATVLFLGCRARQKDKTKMQVVFSFEYAPHEELTLDQFPDFPDVAGKIKKAFDYIWAWVRERKDGNRTMRQPMYISVDQVYKSADFSLLGIGVDLPATANILP